MNSISHATRAPAAQGTGFRHASPGCYRAGLMLSVLSLLGAVPLWSQQAYVANFYSDSVSVIDTSTNTVVATVAVPSINSENTQGSRPVAVAITPDGTRAYVTANYDDTVSVIDTGTNTVVATVVVGNSPYGVAITPDGTRAYVVNSFDGTVSVIDTSTNTVVATVGGLASTPYGVAITPDGTVAYVTNTGSNTVSVIDTSTNTVVAGVGVGSSPYGVAITPDGTHAYVANVGSNTVSVIKTSTNTVVSTVGVGTYPYGVAITPDGTRAYVTNQGGTTVSVIDTSTNTVVAAVTVPTYPSAVAITPDGSSAYVTNGNSTTVAVIDTSTNTVVASVGVGLAPLGMAITPAPRVPFSAFSAELQLLTGKVPAFDLEARFTLGAGSDGINPLTEPVTLAVGSYTVTLPAGSFHEVRLGSLTGYLYVGSINKVLLNLQIVPAGDNSYAFDAAGVPVALTGSTSAVPITLTLGNDTGTTTVTALVFG